MPTDIPHVLVLGATGTTGRRLVHELAERGARVRAASRHAGAAGAAGAADASGAEGAVGVTPVMFDWTDPATYGPALDGADAVYLIAPPADPAPGACMAPFVARAVAAGVDRLVLLSASAVGPETPGLGELQSMVADAGVGWAVLRPSWFMQNLWNPGHPIGAAVRAGAEIVTATGEGRVAFVDAGDIARVAAHALADPVAPDRDLIITGPAALSYDEVAATLSASLGRTVRHRAVTAAEAVDALSQAGIPRAFAEVLAGLDVAIAGGAEDRVTDTVARITGTPPRPLTAVLDTDTPFESELP